ncbi:Iridoid synthase [Podospora aff. communis PSN243]|uniref:Iridoid synthase n=1 Tax=Podospora aff. communis PSN243 TaxID=3040156 RepID=A0AAV9GN62_9PEZI|nr:Iridoid synthase [Podospora aff. communis PSN243]
MASTKSFNEYQESLQDSLLPGKSSVNISTSRGFSYTLDVPSFRDGAHLERSNTSEWDTSRVSLSHTQFRALLFPDEAHNGSFHKKCAAEVAAIKTFFPYLRDESLIICFTAWLSFACAMDDILETLEPPTRENTLIQCVDVVERKLPSTCTGRLRQSPRAGDPRVPVLTQALLAHCKTYLSRDSFQAFFKAIVAVFHAHIEESRFIRGLIPADLPTYMQFRCQTISLNPFFELIKCEYLDAEWKSSAVWDKLQMQVSRAAGLQNDLIGLERDMKDGEPLNAVIVLLRAAGSHDNNQVSNALLADLVKSVAGDHNQSVALALDVVGDICLAASAVSRETFMAVTSVMRHILSLADTHLQWCSTAKRYNANISQKSISASAPTPVSSEPNTHTVRSVGIYHGLPTYPESDPDTGLTALVTGATGLSGYHMVRVLASSTRWKKIICLGSRPPPANFFTDLGDGADRVEHLAVDFRSDPSEIARRLSERVSKVDCIFYFSYMQPAPKGDILNLWANADELATVNSTMFTNFLAALPLTPLTPTRFLLQTGTKHYGFYLGPAPLPAFESDPRIPPHLGGRNFYYEQEDALHTYCTTTNPSCSWGVARPSYIIGAVPDGSLNHLVGFGVYAAVQARLGEALRFPGDYRAWDREQVQSSAMLNAYFEEWMVLSDKAKNEAFNVHDGGCFTWGRVWPLLAGWYGVGWTPPEEEGGGRYRVLVLSEGGTPRGYGPQAMLRSTGSLLEWSLRPEVEAAWKELAREHGLLLDPFADEYRARIFSFSDSAVIGDAPMTTSLRKARDFGFYGTVDSYRSIFDTMHELARLRLIPRPVVEEFECGY